MLPLHISFAILLIAGGILFFLFISVDAQQLLRFNIKINNRFYLLLESSAFLGLLMLGGFKFISSPLLSPFEKRAWILIISYSIAVAIYSFFRLIPKSIKESIANAVILSVAQGFWYLLAVYWFDFPTNQPDISSLKWFFLKLPIVVIPTFIGILLLEILILFFHSKNKRKKIPS